MPRAVGVEFSDTREGYLDRANIPKEGFETHFLAPASTKAQSSFPVVDGDGVLRRGNVVQAWKQRERSDRADLERRIRQLARYFEENPIGDDLEDPLADIYSDTVTTLDVAEDLEFGATAGRAELDFSHEEFTERVGDGFNEYGVRENYDGNDSLESVDVIFEAMEPGPPERRNGVRITDDFLQEVASKDYGGERPPHLKDHNATDTFSRIGEVRNVWFSDRLGKLMLMTRTPNVQGSQNHQEAIARYTHNPPEIRNGSVGFGRQYEAVRNDDGEPELVDGELREFSTVNFPGGYDDGGIKAAFAEAAQDAVGDFDDSPNGKETREGDGDENSAALTIHTTTDTY